MTQWEPPQEAYPEYEAVASEQDDLGEVSDEDFDASLGAIQERIKVANYLQLLLEAPLFGDDQTDVARLVLARVRTLFRQEAEIVLGIRQNRQAQVVESVFSPEEVQALKTLAARVLTPKPAAAPQVQPVAKPAPPPAPPKVQPVVQAQVPKVQPVKTPAAPPPPPPKPQGKSVIPRLQARPAVQPAPERQPPPPPVKPRTSVAERISGVQATPTGRLQRVMTMPDNDVPPEVKARAMEIGMSVRDYLAQDMTPQAVPTQRIPMPDNGMMTVVTQQQAMATVQAQGNKTGRIAALSGATQ